MDNSISPSFRRIGCLIAGMSDARQETMYWKAKPSRLGERVIFVYLDCPSSEITIEVDNSTSPKPEGRELDILEPLPFQGRWGKGKGDGGERKGRKRQKTPDNALDTSLVDALAPPQEREKDKRNLGRRPGHLLSRRPGRPRNDRGKEKTHLCLLYDLAYPPNNHFSSCQVVSV